MPRRAVRGSREVAERIARTIRGVGDREAALMYGVSERTVRLWRQIAAGEKPLGAFPGFRTREALERWDRASREILQAINIAQRAAFQIEMRRAEEVVRRQIGLPPAPPVGEPVPAQVTQVQVGRAAEISQAWERRVEGIVRAQGVAHVSVEGMDIPVVSAPVRGKVRATFASVGDAARAFSLIRVPHYFVIFLRPDGRADLIELPRVRRPRPRRARGGASRERSRSHR